MLNVNVSARNFMYAKMIIFGIFLHIVVKIENIQQVLWMIQQLCAMELKKEQFQ